MDYSGARQDSDPSDKSSGPAFTKQQGTQTDQRSRLIVTPFHNSPIVTKDASLRIKRLHPGREKASGGGLLLGTPGGGTSAHPAAASSSEKQIPTSGSPQTTPAGKKTAKPASAEAVKSEPSTPKRAQKEKSKVRIVSTSVKSQAVKRKKRKMGMYNLVPKKKAKAKGEREATLEKQQTASDEKPLNIPTPANGGEQSVGWSELPTDGENSHVEYTEFALDCLDLKAQEEFLSPTLSCGIEGEDELEDVDLADELPLCCCRMETPPSSGSLSALEQTCMAMESADGMLNRCHRPVMKQEMMRPSNTVHLLVLCEDHRAGMVKHQCCPGCGLFCRAGTFMECRPYGSISHRFHQDCASILKDQRFCPHCGEDASGAKEVVVSKTDLSPSVTKSNPGQSLPLVAALPLVSATPVHQILRARKTSQPQRPRDESMSNFKEEQHVHTNDSLETILMALDDENLKPKKTKYPTRQLYFSAKQGDLQRVVQLLVNGKDPNFLIEGQNRRTPLHAAAAEGHQEICHMLVQAGANLDMFDEEFKTPLMAACENNHLDTVKYLLRAGASASHKDTMGFTCLHLAAKLGHYDVLDHLLSKASKHINGQDDGGWTPITWATEYKHKEVVRLLLAKGADVNIRDKEENVCLHWAALSGCEDIAQALLEAQCDLHAVNVHGDTPLHVAARENHLECVMLFLCRGADVTQTNKEGQTALDCCVCGSKVWTALKTNKKLTEAKKGQISQGERLLCRDISRGYEAVPITCVNGVDSEPCPGNFRYIPDNCVTSQLNIDKDITHLQHCGCTDDCSSSTCTCGQLSVRCWYDNEGRLPLEFCQWDPLVLFECNHACSCWRTCRNRVVQNGIRVRLQLYKTEKMGWGVRAMQDISQGTFICEYVGEIITDAEGDKRENDSFLFTLDNKVGNTYCIDARLFGNIGRFINHLCEPNLQAVKVFTMHQDQRFPRIAFFSSRAIKVGDQIGIDYGDNYWRVKSKYFNCQCGSVKCRHSASSQ
ncbi:unnamed protein product [Menidia menidia]|uniref:(Atlantic silverside) hypothetical protein n=1 Tax=Menidia menidia TaxID=238744 RepID=A0A8S4AWW2_9TELE|nr:unnamed protein product [Menidia menidia]